MILEKYRVYFTYEDTYMYADVFVDGEKYEEYGYLEINLSGGQSVNIPPFIKVLKDVSDDQNYDNYTKAVGEKSAELKKGHLIDDFLTQYISLIRCFLN